MSSSIKAIIFDFGNVLAFFDYHPMFQQILPHTRLTEGEIRTAIAESDLQEIFESGQITSDDFLNHLTRICKLCCPQEVLARAWSNIFTGNQDIFDLIVRLRPDYRLLLGSNTNELHARQFRRQFADVFHYFDELVLSFQVGACKPKAEFFQKCHELAGYEPKECLFIDDLATNIEAARKYGFHGIVYKNCADLIHQMGSLGIVDRDQ